MADKDDRIGWSSEGSANITASWSAYTFSAETGGDPNAICNTGRIRPSEQAPMIVNATVFISNSAFNTTLARSGGQSVGTIQIAASTNVPTGTSVTVELFRQSGSPSTIASYVDPADGQRIVTITAGGTPGIAEFTVGTKDNNMQSGSVVYRARIISVTSGNPKVIVMPGNPVAGTDTIKFTVQ